MKKEICLAFLTGLISLTSIASAGVKEAGGDESNESLLFKCVSAPNVDSALTVLGVRHEFGSGVDLLIYIHGKKIIQDTGILGLDAKKFIGNVFDIEFAPSEDLPSKITAKSESPILHTGSSDTICCEWVR